MANALRLLAGMPHLLHAGTLTSGPESGLCNQIMALIGYVFIILESRGQQAAQGLPCNRNTPVCGSLRGISFSCDSKLAHKPTYLLFGMHKRKSPFVFKSPLTTLVLPNFTSHDTGGFDVPFTHLYDAGAFAKALAPLGISVRESAVGGPDDEHCWPKSLAGWRVFKQFMHDREMMNGTHPYQAAESAVYKGLQLSVLMQRRVAAAAATMGLSTTAGYGCLHARIERDVLVSWPMVRAGPPPLLMHYLDGMAQWGELRQTQRIFVAVGLAITAQEMEFLDTQSTSWGAQLVRSSSMLKMPLTAVTVLWCHSLLPRPSEMQGYGPGLRYTPFPSVATQPPRPLVAAVSLREGAHVGRSLHPSTSRSSGQFKSWAKRLKSASALSYIEAAIIDFEVCRNADWLVGWSGSSFTRTLAQFRWHQHGSGWFSACPDGLRKSTAREIQQRYWGLCNASAASWKHWPGPNPKRAAHHSMNKCWLGARKAAAIAGANHTRASERAPSNSSGNETSFPGGCSFGLPRKGRRNAGGQLRSRRRDAGDADGPASS